MLAPAQLATGAVIITVDLSKPKEAVPSLVRSLALVRERLGAVFGPLEERGHKLPQQLRQRARTKLLDAQRNLNPDSQRVDVTGVHVVVVGTKHDLLKRQIAGHPSEGDLWAVLGNALRHVCHANGASLAYLGALGRGEGDASALYQEQREVVRLLCDFVAFYDPPVVNSRRVLDSVRTDPRGMLLVPAGCDSFGAIQGPPGAAAEGPGAAAAWERYVAQVFPDEEEKPVDKKEQVLASKRVPGIERGGAYREDLVDSLVEAKRAGFAEEDRQLERAAKEREEKLERARRAQAQARPAGRAPSNVGRGGGDGG